MRLASMRACDPPIQPYWPDASCRMRTLSAAGAGFLLPSVAAGARRAAIKVPVSQNQIKSRFNIVALEWSQRRQDHSPAGPPQSGQLRLVETTDWKSTRLNSSHGYISH